MIKPPSKLIRGFTLIELLVVIAIIGILSTVVMAILNTARARARYASMIIKLDQIAVAAYLDYDTNKQWANDTGPSNPAPSFVGTTIAAWPKVPCSNWTYDWENWPVANNTPTIRVTVRSSTTGGTNANARYYLCIQSTDNVSCHAGGPSLGGSDTSVDVKKSLPSERTLNCN